MKCTSATCGEHLLITTFRCLPIAKGSCALRRKLNRSFGTRFPLGAVGPDSSKILYSDEEKWSIIPISPRKIDYIQELQVVTQRSCLHTWIVVRCITSCPKTSHPPTSDVQMLSKSGRNNPSGKYGIVFTTTQVYIIPACVSLPRCLHDSVTRMSLSSETNSKLSAPSWPLQGVNK